MILSNALSVLKFIFATEKKEALPELAERSGCFRRRPFSLYSYSAYVYDWKDDLIDNRTVSIIQRRSATDFLRFGGAAILKITVVAGRFKRVQ